MCRFRGNVVAGLQAKRAHRRRHVNSAIDPDSRAGAAALFGRRPWACWRSRRSLSMSGCPKDGNEESRDSREEVASAMLGVIALTAEVVEVAVCVVAMP
eukprot:2301568-Pleurochrysis_carterae.AAC.1